MLRHVTCKTYPIQRSRGHSAVAGAAYRAGARLLDERTGERHDYRTRQRDVRESFILAPAGAPDWARNRQSLWNRCEAAEVKINGRPGREVQLGLARELAPDIQRELVTRFAQREFVDKGYIVDVAIHNYGQRALPFTDEGRDAVRRWAALGFPFLEENEAQGRHDGHVKIERNGTGVVLGYKVYQPHAHCYVSGRPLDGEEFAARKSREFNSYGAAKDWRYDWPKLQNEYLEAAGLEVRVSALGETEEGYAELHLAPEQLTRPAYGLERRGIKDGEQELHAQLMEKQQQRIEESREKNELTVIHRDTERQAIADETVTRAASREDEQGRALAWWRTMQARFGQWRGSFEDKAAEWQQRFEHRAGQLMERFGRQQAAPTDETGPQIGAEREPPGTMAQPARDGPGEHRAPPTEREPEQGE